MRRRAFLEVAAASLLAPVLTAGEQYDVQRATLQDLIVLLGHPTLFQPRQDAQRELLRRGTEEIRNKGQLLSWKQELIPVAEMNRDHRLRLEAILRILTAEEERLLWSPLCMPEVSGYEPGEMTAMRPYFSALDAALGGGIDCERLTQERWRKSDEPRRLSAGIVGEPFWEFVRRNQNNFTIWGEEGRLICDPNPDERHFACDGALAGRLAFDTCGATVFLMTNPGMEFLGCRVLQSTLVTDRGSSDVAVEPEYTNASALAFCLPRYCDPGAVSGFSLALKTLGAPVATLSVREFTQHSTQKIGPFTVTLRPQGTRICGREGTVRHTLPCQLTMPNAWEGVFKPFQSRFFTAYGANGVQYSGPHGSCTRIPGGREFLLSFPEPLTRLDIRVPDFERMSEGEHRLRFEVGGG